MTDIDSNPATKGELPAVMQSVNQKVGGTSGNPPDGELRPERGKRSGLVRMPCSTRHFMLLLLFATCAICPVHAQEEPPMVSIRPKPVAGPVLNPGKGWIAYGGVRGMSKEVIALASVGYNRFEWGELEPVEGAYDWTQLDRFMAEWAKHGKQVAFGVMNANTHSKAKDGYVTPKWVYDAGVKAKTWEIKPGTDAMKGNPGWKREPVDFHHPILMQKLENFVKAMATRYDGHPSIAFIDIRSFKNWGETMSEQHSEIYLKYFKKTRLCNSTQHGHHQTNWCVERGIAVRRDGIGGSKGQEMIPAAGKVPVIFEFWGPVWYLKERGWWRDGALISESVEIGKPTYVEIIRSSPEFLRDYRALIDKTTNRIGFHFMLEEARFPKSIQTGKSASLSLSWMNTGVAPIYEPCVVKAALIDSKGNIVDVAIAKGSDPAAWVPGKSVAENAEVIFSKVKSKGTYRLAIGLFGPADHKAPSYLLGSGTAMVGKWHVLGPARID